LDRGWSSLFSEDKKDPQNFERLVNEPENVITSSWQVPGMTSAIETDMTKELESKTWTA